MTVINLSVDAIPCASWPILLGQRRENGVTQVRLNYQPWIDELGEGVILLFVRRYGDAAAYPVVLQTADGVAVWTVSELDTAINGEGKAEYVFMVENQRKKSAVFTTFTAPDLGCVPGDPPDPYQTWVDDLTELGAESLSSAQDAEAWAVGERGGEDVPQSDPTYHNNAKYYADSAGETVSAFTETTAPAAVQAVNTAGQTQIGAVNTAGQTQVGAVNTAGQTALTAVGEARTAAVNAVQQKGEEVLDELQDYADLPEDVADLKSALNAKINKEIVNLIDVNSSVSGHLNYNGNIEPGSAFKTTDFIPIDFGRTYVVTPAARFALFYYRSDKAVISDSYMNVDTANYTITPDRNMWVRISYRVSLEETISMKSYTDDSGYKLEEGINLSNYLKEQIETIIKTETKDYLKKPAVQNIVNETNLEYFSKQNSANLFNKSAELETGFLQTGGVITTEGAYANYLTSPLILLDAGTYTLGRYPVVATRMPVCIYDMKGTYESYIYSGNADNYVTFTIENQKYIRFSSSDPRMNTTMLVSGDVLPSEYIPYEIITELNPSILIPQSGNILFGKKWWACGDSFTEWTTEEFDSEKYPNITVVDERHHYATYPFWIGARNGMTVHNFAVSGQTMAMPASPGSFTNAFSNNKYKQIPSDVDYITLWFGINDSHHRPGSAGADGESNEGEIPLGTINDTTTATFYGAWNVVLPYLIEHYPWAKIGIIITNGAESPEYAEAEIAIAKKWGIPYLDLNGDYHIPLMLRIDGKPEVCAEAIALRKAQQWASVEQGNGHPNVNAHKFESTFIEAWLRSI